MMKKILSFLLVSLIILSSFTVFASANIVGDIDGDGEVTSSDAREVLRASVGLVTLSGAAAAAADADGDKKITSSDARLILRKSVGLEELFDPAKYTFTGVNVFNNEKFKFDFTSIDPDSASGYLINGEFCNKSETKTYYLSVDLYVNGMGTDVDLVFTVKPGDTRNCIIQIDENYYSFFGMNGYFSDIEAYCTVYDSKKEDAEPIAENTAVIYPYGAEYANVGGSRDTSKDKKLISDKYIMLSLIDCEKIGAYYYVDLYFENKMDDFVAFASEDNSADGTPVDFAWGGYVEAHKGKIFSFVFDESFFKNIKSVKNLDVKLTLLTADGTKEYSKTVKMK